MHNITIGTRGSDLALWQAHHAKSLLSAINIEAELKIIKTKGDRIQHLSFDKIEGKGFFTREIEEALLNKEIDLAVHSLKDLPTEQPEGLTIAGLSYRDNPADLLIARKEKSEPGNILNLPDTAIIGTSSARRKAQILRYKPQAVLKDIRGNVPTRLGKLSDGQFDAILLAAAGVYRLNIDLSDFQVYEFNPREFIPAPGQGVIAFQTRKDDMETRKAIREIHNQAIAANTNIERKVLKLMGGGCHMPLGVFCTMDDLSNFHVSAGYAPTWQAPFVTCAFSSTTSFELAETIVKLLKEKL